MDKTRLRELVAAECNRLEKLGSAEAVARELASRGMSGKRRQGDQCPLARGLCDTLMIGHGPLWVLPNAVLLGRPADGEELVSFKEMPVLHDFVLAFDASEFPYLIQAGD